MCFVFLPERGEIPAWWVRWRGNRSGERSLGWQPDVWRCTFCFDQHYWYYYGRVEKQKKRIRHESRDSFPSLFVPSMPWFLVLCFCLKQANRGAQTCPRMPSYANFYTRFVKPFLNMHLFFNFFFYVKLKSPLFRWTSCSLGVSRFFLTSCLDFHLDSANAPCSMLGGRGLLSDPIWSKKWIYPKRTAKCFSVGKLFEKRKPREAKIQICWCVFLKIWSELFYVYGLRKWVFC